MENINTVVSSVVVSGFCSAALIWLTKSWISERLRSSIQTEYAEKLETHKAQLAANNDISIERLKSQLQIVAAERNIRFARIFEQIAEITAETYAKLRAFHDAVTDYTTPIETQSTPPKAERRKIVQQRFTELQNYLRPNRLFFPKETAKRIDDFQSKVHEKVFKFMMEVEEGNPRTGPNREVWFDTVEFLNKEAVSLLELLEDDFRSILGTMRAEQQSTLGLEPTIVPHSKPN